VFLALPASGLLERVFLALRASGQSARNTEKRGPAPTNAANSMRLEWGALRPALK